MAQPRSDLARITLSVLFIGALLAGSLWVLAPFLGAFIWATMIVVATWPMLLRLQQALGGRRGPAVAVMSLGLLAILIVPLVAAIDAILRQSDALTALVDRLPTLKLPAAPAWLDKVPLAGDRLRAAWNHFAGAGMSDLLAWLQPYVSDVASWLAHRAGSFAVVMFQFLLVVILSAVLYANGDSWAAWARRFGRRLADERGERMVRLAGGAIRGVAMGVVVTALIQTVLSGIGLAIAGVPYAGVLSAIILMLCIAQLGPILVLLGATAWVYYTVGPGWGTFMLVWSLVVGMMDNFVRPVLIRRGADLPLLLIFAGVIGGLIGFGIVGIFVGPVILAITFTLLDEWVTPQAQGSGVAPPATTSP